MSDAWRVRRAKRSDAEAVAVAVAKLLLELGGSLPAARKMREATRALIDSREAGAVLVAEAGGELIGVLAASWQLAIHAPGAYALIQDLWVDPAWRGQAIGRALLDSLFALAHARQVQRVEVGLPHESFTGFVATEAFYSRNGFGANGPRMRRVLG